MDKKFEKLRSIPDKYRHRTPAMIRTDKRLSLAWRLYATCLKEKQEIRVKAGKNFIINVVTIVETFLRDIIIEEKKAWKAKGFEQLLMEKITLNDAYELLRRPAIRKTHIIAEYHSLKNLSSIDNIFSALLQTKFLNLIGRYEIDGHPGHSLDATYEDWRKEFEELFQLRNEITHEDAVVRIVKDDVDYYYSFVDHFCTAMSSMLFEMTLHPKSRALRRKVLNRKIENYTDDSDFLDI